MKHCLWVCLLALSGLLSCTSKRDFAYNEKMTSLFYSCRENLDDRHQKLTEGGFDNDHSSEVSFETTLKNARGLGIYCNEVKAEAAQLPHSEAANAFHASVLNYMTEIADAYTPLLSRYVQLTDTTARRKLKTELDLERQALGIMEDKCLETQIAFLKVAGIKTDESSTR